MQPVKDMTGMKFGRLTAVRRHGTDGKGNVTWDCECECGGKSVVRGGHLRSGQVSSCGGKGRGCARLESLDLVGKVFGRLTVIEECGRRRNRSGNTQILRCQCTCGKEHRTTRPSLINGTCQSCGCLHSEITTKRSIKHGRHGTPEYRLLYSCKSRSKKHSIPFDLELDDILIPDVCPLLGLKLKPAKGAISPCSPTLDRRDPGLGYTKGNVWVISQKANRMKSNLTLAMMKHFVAVMEGSLRQDLDDPCSDRSP